MSEYPNLWDFLGSDFRNFSTVTIDAASVPEPYRELLVHRQSMTLVLEDAYREELQLRILRQEFSQQSLVRQVVLLRPSDGKPVEIGLIRMHLQRFPIEVAKEARDGNRPLGKLLQELGVEYSNRPSAYFRVGSNGVIGETLNVSNSHDLYGRCNRLSTPSGETLAEVIEVLAPFEPAAEQSKPAGEPQL